jgi:small-conductance mechanosensitive channel
VTGTTAPAENGTPPAETAPPEEDVPPVEGESVESVQDVATAVLARTPVPTSTPDRIDRQIEEIISQAGLSETTFLGLQVEDWFNILITILITLAVYFIIIKLLMKLLLRMVKKTEKKLDDDILALIAKYLNWLLVLLLIRFALSRLDFIGERLWTAINDLLFIAAVGVMSIIAMDLIQFAVNRYEAGFATDEDQRKLTPIIITVKRLAQSAVLIVAFSIILSHFGINISIILVVLVIGGFIISFGAQDILTDILSGYIILIDKPFRVGDSILIKELDTRGVVLEIGTRSTQIKTGDNREVIIPNSSIGQSQVVNYTYPDSQFRVQTDIGVAYGTDVEKMHKVIEEAVRGVEGVLHDKPVNIYYLKFGDSARMVRVRWWIDTYKDEKPMLDKVNSVLELALGDAGIELPYNTYDLNVKMNE